MITTGDYYNCKCPYCGTPNHNLTKYITFENFIIFKKECRFCFKFFEVFAEWRICVKLYTEGEHNFPLKKYDKDGYILED